MRKIHQNLIKIGLGVVWGPLGASWGYLGDHLGPKIAPRPFRTPKKTFQVTPWVPRWSQNPPKIDLEASQKEVVFLIGCGVGF